MASQVKIDLKSVWDGSGVAQATADINAVGKAAGKTAKETTAAVAPARDLGAELNEVGQQGEAAMQATAVATNAMTGNISGAASAVLQLTNSLKLLSAVKLGLISILIMSLVELVKTFKGRVDAARKSLAELDSMRMEMATSAAEHLASKYERVASAIEKAASHEKALLDLSGRAVDASAPLQDKAISDKYDKQIAGAGSLEEVERLEAAKTAAIAAASQERAQAKAAYAVESAQAEKAAAEATLAANREALEARVEQERDALDRVHEIEERLSEGAYGKRGEAYDKALENRAKGYEAVKAAALATRSATDAVAEAENKVVTATKAVEVATKEADAVRAAADKSQAEAAKKNVENLKAEADATKAKAEATKKADDEAKARAAGLATLRQQAAAKQAQLDAGDLNREIARLKQAVADDEANPLGSFREFTTGEFQRRQRRAEKEREKAARPEEKARERLADIEKRMKDRDYVSPREQEWQKAMRERIDKRNALAAAEAKKKALEDAAIAQQRKDVAEIRKKIDDVLVVKG